MPWPPAFLVIEDDPLYRTLYTRSLLRFFPDARIIQASDGAEAKARLGDDRFDLVVMDLHMPVLDGVQLLAQIKQDPAHHDLVVMVVSAFDEHARSVHVAHYPNVFAFPKPLRADELQMITLQCLRLAAQLRMNGEPSSKPPPDIVDRGHIALYVGQSGELQNAISEQFILHAPNLVERLQRAIWANDYSLTASLAQDVHASTAVIGAHRAAKLAHRLRLCAGGMDRALCDSLCKQLCEAVQAYVSALTTSTQRNPRAMH